MSIELIQVRPFQFSPQRVVDKVVFCSFQQIVRLLIGHQPQLNVLLLLDGHIAQQVLPQGLLILHVEPHDSRTLLYMTGGCIPFRILFFCTAALFDTFAQTCSNMAGADSQRIESQP